MNANRRQASAAARRWLENNPLFLDTETTGLGEADQVCDLAVVDADGALLFNSLIRPGVRLGERARALHGIRDFDLLYAPTLPEVLDNLRALLAGRPVVVYNADFDHRLLCQSGGEAAAQAAAVWRCAMKLYAVFYDDYDPRRGDYRWQKLEAAAARCGLRVPLSLHRAHTNADLCRQVVHHMARDT